MLKKYIKILIRKINKYDISKNYFRKHPFLNKDFETNPFKDVYEQKYYWIS